jgi:hypothetical protein
VEQQSPFRSFSAIDFQTSATWLRVERILAGNGGCYGLYGPRGSGKSWLMLNAIDQAERGGGLGLWFPCPSEYESEAFLAMLAGNLANLVKRRYNRDSLGSTLTRPLQAVLSLIVAVPLATTAVVYAVHSLSGRNVLRLPTAAWIVVAIAALLLAGLTGVQLAWERGRVGRLVGEAISLRERVRFTVRMTLGTDVDLSGGSPIAARLRHKRERELDERPLTVASLVFEFRHLAELITATTGHGLVIGIDELDKIDDPAAVVRLLRDIKGIFEIENVTFLVSVSEEAAAALQTGVLRASGRNEFNSSFYAVVELPPLDPRGAAELLKHRHTGISERRAYLLCLLAAGNPREIVRLAERTQPLADDDLAVITAVREEVEGLLRELIASTNEEARLTTIWDMFPASAFATIKAFTELGTRAIVGWAQQDEAWCRLYIRLFVAGAVVRDKSDSEVIGDLLGVMTMATRSATVARLMLRERFGQELDGPYRKPA